MVRHTLKTLQQILQDFKSVSDHFTTLRSEELIYGVVSTLFTWVFIGENPDINFSLLLYK